MLCSLTGLPQFEYIYSLSLAMRTDRRDGMALVSSASNMQVDFVDGVPGKTIHDKALPPVGFGVTQSRRSAHMAYSIGIESNKQITLWAAGEDT
jgi:hypothetical protein